MRAMMSDSGSRSDVLVHNAHGCADFGVTWKDVASDNAEAEARRVMAEAEPGDGRRVPAFRVEWGAAPTWARADASLDAGAPYFLALAEALAAFVGASDPAEYLEAVAQ